MRGPRDVLWILALSVCFLAAAHPSCANPADFSAGFVSVTLRDPVEDGPMTAIFAYPTMQPPSRTALGPYTIEATRNATPTIGRFPLIVVSHGTGGSALGHHDSLTALAGAGFIAAAVEHPATIIATRAASAPICS